MSRKLTDQELDWLINDVFQGVQIDQTIEKLKLGNRRGLNKFLKENPEIQQLVTEAEQDSCPYLENDLLNIHRKAKGDPKLARVLADAIVRILQFRKPEKYGNKIDLNMNVVSIAMNLQKANDRVKALMKDVNPDEVIQIEAPISAEYSSKKGRGRPKKQSVTEISNCPAEIIEPGKTKTESELNEMSAETLDLQAKNPKP